MSEVVEQLAPGTRVGGCTIEEFISTGGLGVVYRGRDAQGRRVAVKVGKVPATALSAKQLVLQQNEIEALTRLKHPSLVEVHGYGFLDDGRIYLVMELVEGQLLRTYLQERAPLDALEATRMVRCLAEALAFCHDSNVLHLDLKPANIVLTDPFEPRVKVLDFGLARLSGGFRKGEAEMFVGTLEYMAPECFFGEGDRYSRKVDLYALGTIFYEMLAGRVPHRAYGSLADLVATKRSGTFPPLDVAAPQVPRAVVGLVHSLLAAQPERRFSSAALLAHRLKALYFDALQAGGGGSAVPEVAPPSEVGHAEAAFVGRQAELGPIREALAFVQGGEGRSLAVVGEAGIGKTRLISEALSGPEAAGTLVGYGRCRPLGGLVPYSPLREALGHLAALAAEDRTGDISLVGQKLGGALLGEAQPLLRLVPELSQLLPQSLPAGAAEGAVVQGMGAELVARALHHFLDALGEVRASALVIEDIHWADEGTLAALFHLWASARPPRVLVLCTSRPFDRLLQHAGLAVVALPPLSSAENQALLGALTGGAEPAVIAALQEAVPVLSAGNPLVCAQVVRHLQVEGYLSVGRDGRLGISDRIREGYRPPDSLSAVFERALERLDASALRVLRVAARIDRQFRGSDLSALGLFSPEEVQSALQAAQQERLCTRTGDRYSFSHDALREKLSGSVEADRAADIHRRIAQRLEERGASPGTLAHHLRMAGEPVASARAYLRAGLEADELHDPHGASAHLKRAFDLLAEVADGPERNDLMVRTLHELVRVAALFGAAADTLTFLERGAALIATQTPEQALALSSAYARMYYAQADFRKAGEYAARCLSTKSADPALRKYHYIPANIIGRAMAGSGKWGPAMPVLTEGFNLAMEAGELVERVHTEGIMAVALGYIGEFDRAREHADSALRNARRLGNAVRIAAGYFYYSCIAEAQCRWDEGVERTAELLAYLEETGTTGLYLVVGTVYAARHQFHLGRLDRARLLINRAMTLAQQLGTQYGMASAHAYLGDIELVAQRMEEAKKAYAAGLDLSNAGNKDELAAPLCLIGLAHHAALTGGSLADVQRLADEAVERCKAVSNHTVLAVAYQRYADALEQLGHPELAEPCRAQWQELQRRYGMEECDFWPRPVEGSGVQVASRREYWRTYPTRAAGQRLLADEETDTLISTPAPKPVSD